MNICYCFCQLRVDISIIHVSKYQSLYIIQSFNYSRLSMDFFLFFIINILFMFGTAPHQVNFLCRFLSSTPSLLFFRRPFYSFVPFLLLLLCWWCCFWRVTPVVNNKYIGTNNGVSQFPGKMWISSYFAKSNCRLDHCCSSALSIGNLNNHHQRYRSSNLTELDKKLDPASLILIRDCGTICIESSTSSEDILY